MQSWQQTFCKVAKKHSDGLSAVILFLAIFLSYSNVYNFDFIYDDEFFIVKNEHLNSFSSIGEIFSSSSTAGSGFKDSFFRPVQFSLYLLVRQTLGSEPWGFHLLNLMIHFLNAFLFYILAVRLKFSKKIAVLIALLWCVHPIHTECIAYKSATADSLHTFFLMLGLYIMLPIMTVKRAVVGWFCFLLAILSKETAVLGAPLLTVCVFYFSENRWKLKTYFKTIPFWFMSLGYAVLRKTLLNFDGDFAFYKESNIYTENIIYRFYTFLATLPEYLRLLVWPQDLHIDRQFSVYIDPFNSLVMMGFAMCVLATLILLWCVIKRSPKSFIAAFIVLWFVATHLLHSGVIIPLNSLFLEHWMYMPSMAFFLTVGLALQFFEKRDHILKKTVFIGTLIITLLLAQFTNAQNQIWSSSISLFSHILRLNPNVARVRHGLAMAYSDQGKDDKALELYQEALTQQIYPQTYHNMALVYLKKNNFEKAEEYLLKAIEQDPNFFPSYPYLVALYNQLQKTDLAKKYEQQYLHLKK